MAYVGSINGIPFIVSSRYLRTFSDYNRSIKSKWATHDIIGQKPKLEFLGSDLENISFKMLLRKDLGVNPEEEIETLKKWCDEGEYFPIIINQKPINDNYWVITSISETILHTDAYGEIISAEVSLSLTEYVKDKEV